MDVEPKGRTRIGRAVAAAAAVLALATFGAVVAWGRQPASEDTTTIPGYVAPTSTSPNVSPFPQTPRLIPMPRRHSYGGPYYGSPRTLPAPSPQGPGNDEDQDLSPKEQLS